MAAKSAKNTDLETDLVRKLAVLLDENQLTEIEYETEDLRVRVARQETAIAAAPMAAPMAAPTPAPGAPAEGTHAPDAPANHPGVVVSPMVGVAYTAPDPDSPAFVKVGDTVNEGDTLLLIEAMKVFNQINAPRSGKVSQMLIDNGTPVEFGEPLLIIE